LIIQSEWLNSSSSTLFQQYLRSVKTLMNFYGNFKNERMRGLRFLLTIFGQIIKHNLLETLIGAKNFINKDSHFRNLDAI